MVCISGGWWWWWLVVDAGPAATAMRALWMLERFMYLTGGTSVRRTRHPSRKRIRNGARQQTHNRTHKKKPNENAHKSRAHECQAHQRAATRRLHKHITDGAATVDPMKYYCRKFRARKIHSRARARDRFSVVIINFGQARFLRARVAPISMAVLIYADLIFGTVSARAVSEHSSVDLRTGDDGGPV